jgi:DNA-binding Lrp family transcriptional regulator
LDATDRAILRELQKDARITNVELARRVGLTPPPTLRRMRNLEEHEVIQGYHACVNPAMLGWAITVIVMVSLKDQSAAELKRFEEHVAGLAEVRECHMLSGETDFMLKIVARDLPAFQDLLVHQIIAAPNVSGVRTALIIRSSKQAPGVPLDD